MEIVAALFVEGIEFRQVDGPSTRIDITGAFSRPPSSRIRRDDAVPRRARSPAGSEGNGTLETVFVRESGEEVGRNSQPFFVEPGKFGYRLVRGELDFEEPGTIEARCTILESGSAVTVPLTALPLA
jgi:hypothetical protein